MTDMGAINYFLGISASRSFAGLFLSQQKYATQILEYANMLKYNPARTPAELTHKLGVDGTYVTDPTLYRSFDEDLQYLTLDRTLPLRFNRFVFICMTLESTTSMTSSASFDTYGAH